MRKFLLCVGVVFALISITLIFVLDSGTDDDITNSSHEESTDLDSSDATSTETSLDNTSDEVLESTSTITDSSISYDTGDSNSISISYIDVESIINHLMSIQTQEGIDKYLNTIDKTSDFVFMPVVNRETRVSVENIARGLNKPNEYLAIVTLRQDNGISKFSVTIKFEGSALKSFIMSRF